MEWFWIKAYHHDTFALKNRPFVIMSGIPWSFASFRWFTKYPCLAAYPPSLFVPLCQIYLNINLWSVIQAKLALTNICATRPKPPYGRDCGASSMAKTELIQIGWTKLGFLQLHFCISATSLCAFYQCMAPTLLLWSKKRHQHGAPTDFLDV